MLNEIPVQLLRQIHPVNQLDDRRIEQLLERSQLRTIEEKKKLPANKAGAWLLYLVDGDVYRLPDGDKVPTLLASTDDNYPPLFQEGDAEDAAIITKSKATLLRIDAAFCQQLLDEVHDVSGEAVDVDVSEEEYGLFSEIFEASQKKLLELPAMPEVAMKLRKMLRDEDVGSADVARVIQLDPAVAGRVVQVVNSPLYRGTQPITSVKDAIVRLGLKVSSDLAMAVSLHGTFQAKSPAIKEAMSDAWDESVEVSTLSHLIAKRLKGIDAEQALFAGLIHRIGVVPILNFVERKGFSGNTTELRGTLDKLSSMVSALVLDSWELGGELGSVTEHHADWQRNDVSEADLADVVMMARLIYLRENDHNELPSPDSVPAAERLQAMARKPDEPVWELGAEADQQIEGMRQALTG
jgi:HD-like signal output (HDOD) protein